jgi:hypothetical protein
MPGHDVCIEIGGMAIVVRTGSAEFARLLRDRYGPFVVRAGPPADASSDAPATGEHKALRHLVQGKGRPCGPGVRTSSFDFPVSNFEFPVPSFQLDVELVPPGMVSDAEDARVRLEGGRWVMERGDFRAEWDPERRQGWVRQSSNPYSIDSVLRILHSLILAREGGFLVHAASAIRNGRAFLFAGVSGAGKTTISRLAPPDVVLLTDEISYVRQVRSRESEVRGQKSEVRSQNEDRQNATLSSTTFTSSPTPDAWNLTPASDTSSLTHDTRNLTPAFVAFGTPFAGELARIGENLRAPVAALYLLTQGAGNRIEAVSKAEAARALLQNILFFAQDEELVRLVSQSAFDFVSCVPVCRLVFAPDSRVWELIG